MRLIGARRTMGEPESGPHGRGFRSRHDRQRGAQMAPSPPAAGPPGLAEPAAEEAFPISLVADEALGEEVKGHALDVLRGVATHASRPVLHARMTLHLHGDPAVERPAVAKASLDVGGRPSAPTSRPSRWSRRSTCSSGGCVATSRTSKSATAPAATRPAPSRPAGGATAACLLPAPSTSRGHLRSAGSYAARRSPAQARRPRRPCSRCSCWTTTFTCSRMPRPPKRISSTGAPTG